MASNKCFNDDLINATLNVRSFDLKVISDTIPYQSPIKANLENVTRYDGFFFRRP